jgi:hypothetical protein
MRMSSRMIVALALALPVAAAADEWTVTQPITVLQVYGATEDIYLTGGSTWGSPSCPGATYVRVPQSLAGYKQLLAVSLAAKMSGTPIRVYGTCGANGYFDATNVSVES